MYLIGTSLPFVSVAILCECVCNRYLGTVLGSSVISTTVLGDDQPLSTAVHFQLQHRVQVSQHSQISPITHHFPLYIIYIYYVYYRTPLVLCMIQCVPSGTLISSKYQ